VGFEVTDQLPTSFLHASDPREKIGLECHSASIIHNFKKSCDSVRKEVLYIIVIEFRVPM
jgi:hypothetical protein